MYCNPTVIIVIIFVFYLTINLFLYIILLLPIGAWLSLVERCVRDAEVAGSNPVAPSKYKDIDFWSKDFD